MNNLRIECFAAMCNFVKIVATPLMHLFVAVFAVEPFFIALCMCNSKQRKLCCSRITLDRFHFYFYGKFASYYTVHGHFNKRVYWNYSFVRLPSYCARWFRVLPVYNLIWNIHLSALMWHPIRWCFMSWPTNQPSDIHCIAHCDIEPSIYARCRKATEIYVVRLNVKWRRDMANFRKLSFASALAKREKSMLRFENFKK